jgi:PIN domain nuclease of toxin-antitoxin system
MILLDTHVVVWLLLDPPRLSKRAHNAILQARVAQEPLGYSLISIFEIVYAAGRGRLPLGARPEDFVRAVEKRVLAIPLTSAIAQRAATLAAPFHGDPMDRIIAATAIVEDCILITSDERIRSANVCKTVW